MRDLRELLKLRASERSACLAALAANRSRRERLEREREQARAELAELLSRGSRLGFSITELAQRAGIRRDGSYRLLARAGVPTKRERRRQAEQAGIPRSERRAFYDELERERKRASAAATAPPRPESSGGPDEPAP